MSLTINVTNLGGRVVPVKVEPTDKVSDLRNRAELALGVPIASLLSASGGEVCLTDVVSDTGLADNSTVSVIAGTEHTYNISVCGRGGEIVMGALTEQQYEYWSKVKEKYDADEDDGLLYDCLAGGEDQESKGVPETAVLPAEYWHDIDDVIHECPAFTEYCRLEIQEYHTDRKTTKGDAITIELSDLEESAPDVERAFSEVDETYAECVPGHSYVFYALSCEKGCFFDGWLDTRTPFDLKQLKLFINDIDGTDCLTAIEYGGEQVDNEGGDTTGKSLEFFFVKGTKQEKEQVTDIVHTDTHKEHSAVQDCEQLSQAMPGEGTPIMKRSVSSKVVSADEERPCLKSVASTPNILRRTGSWNKAKDVKSGKGKATDSFTSPQLQQKQTAP